MGSTDLSLTDTMCDSIRLSCWWHDLHVEQISCFASVPSYLGIVRNRVSLSRGYEASWTGRTGLFFSSKPDPQAKTLGGSDLLDFRSWFVTKAGTTAPAHALARPSHREPRPRFRPIIELIVRQHPNQSSLEGVVSCFGGAGGVYLDLPRMLAPSCASSEVCQEAGFSSFLRKGRPKDGFTRITGDRLVVLRPFRRTDRRSMPRPGRIGPSPRGARRAGNRRQLMVPVLARLPLYVVRSAYQ